jgi:hypothetical protein
MVHVLFLDKHMFIETTSFNPKTLKLDRRAVRTNQKNNGLCLADHKELEAALLAKLEAFGNELKSLVNAKALVNLQVKKSGELVKYKVVE